MRNSIYGVLCPTALTVMLLSSNAKRTGRTQKVDERERVDAKVSVTIRLDLDVLNKIRAEDEQKAIPYQTLIQLDSQAAC